MLALSKKLLTVQFSSLRVNPLCNDKEHGNRMWKRWTSPLKRNKAGEQIFSHFEVRKNYKSLYNLKRFSFDTTSEKAFGSKIKQK